MKKRFKSNVFQISSAILAFTVLLSCGLQAQRVERDVEGFSVISYSIPADLEIKQGSSESLVFEGDKDLIDKIITRVEGDRLKIYTKASIRNFSSVKVYLSLIDFNELSIAGSADVRFVTPVKTNRLGINIAGSGDVVSQKIEATSISVDIAGSGDVKVEGITKSLSIEIAGSGDVNAEDLEAMDVKVNVAGSGSAKVWAEESLKTDLVGSGDVRYKGRPIVDANSVGSGSTRSIQ